MSLKIDVGYKRAPSCFTGWTSTHEDGEKGLSDNDVVLDSKHFAVIDQHFFRTEQKTTSFDIFALSRRGNTPLPAESYQQTSSGELSKNKSSTNHVSGAEMGPT